MDRTKANIWAVSAGLMTLLVSVLAYGLGAEEGVIFLGLLAAPFVMFLVFSVLRF